MNKDNLEAMATALEASGNYRILRRLQVDQIVGTATNAEAPSLTACIIDCETTGLECTDEIIQVSILPVRCTTGDRASVVEVLPAFTRYREPSRPIGRVARELTGIDDSKVAGKSIKPEEVLSFIEAHQPSCLISHNVKFDRSFIQRFCRRGELFDRIPWACSLSQIPWEESFRGKALAFLAMQAGIFVRSHDALEDCHAVIAMLNQVLPISKRTALSVLLERIHAQPSRKGATAPGPKVRIRALNAPYERKDCLKGRGYRWCPGSENEPRAWFIDVLEADRAAEVAFLESDILGARGKAVIETLAV